MICNNCNGIGYIDETDLSLSERRLQKELIRVFGLNPIEATEAK